MEESITVLDPFIRSSVTPTLVVLPHSLTYTHRLHTRAVTTYTRLHSVHTHVLTVRTHVYTPAHVHITYTNYVRTHVTYGHVYYGRILCVHTGYVYTYTPITDGTCTYPVKRPRTHMNTHHVYTPVHIHYVHSVLYVYTHYTHTYADVPRTHCGRTLTCAPRTLRIPVNIHPRTYDVHPHVLTCTYTHPRTHNSLIDNPWESVLSRHTLEVDLLLSSLYRTSTQGLPCVRGTGLTYHLLPKDRVPGREKHRVRTTKTRPQTGRTFWEAPGRRVSGPGLQSCEFVAVVTKGVPSVGPLRVEVGLGSPGTVTGWTGPDSSSTGDGETPEYPCLRSVTCHREQQKIDSSKVFLPPLPTRPRGRRTRTEEGVVGRTLSRSSSTG